MEERRIPFNRPRHGDRWIDFLRDAVDNGSIAGPGRYSRRCEAVIARKLGADSAFLVPSCSAALEMSALLIGLAPGDEVIMPSFTFVSTANAVVLRGAVPVFVDVDPVCFNIDPALIEQAITPRTRAIYAVHYAGVPADMTAIMAIAAKHGLMVVEDAAQAYGATRDQRPAGSFAPIACFSFHGTKNISAGEAGALVLNGRDFGDRAAIIREKGTNRIQFQRGEVDAYTWVDVGSSQIVSELTAAFLAAQLEDAEAHQAERLALWERYREGLVPLAEEGFLAVPSPPPTVSHNAHIFFVVLKDRTARDSLKRHLAAEGIDALTHYEPLHRSVAGLRHGRFDAPLVETDRVTSCLLRLPLYPGLGDDQERVIDAVTRWYRQAGDTAATAQTASETT